MQQLKDIASRMDNCHVRTAKRWWKKLNAECIAAKLPPVAPDVQGHGPHRWHDATADRLIALWQNYYTAKGTTPTIIRAKYAGDLTDARQIEFTFPTAQKFHAKKSTSQVRIQPSRMGKTHARAKTGSHAKKKPDQTA